jgi:acetylornithine deacetylase/succinyl-diaminopimelate desuccinylase-like protein
MDPGGIVIPLLMPGATDACQYQKAGIKMYGFTPGILPPGMAMLQLAHGHNERMPISFIETGLPVLWDVVNEFCGRGG